LFGSSGPSTELQWLQTEARVDQGVNPSFLELPFAGPNVQGVVCLFVRRKAGTGGQSKRIRAK
jgi:hypothetical protein